MIGLWKRFATREPAWSGLLGWQVMTYEEGDHWLSLQIEPMLHGPCKVYVPDAPSWSREAPAWATGRRREILQRLRGKVWNRDLTWCVSAEGRLWNRHVNDPWDCSLEATPGGRRLQSLRLFHVDSPVHFSRAHAKRAWCAATEQMCLQLRGEIDLIETAVIPGSVFQEVAIPALTRNRQARLNWIRPGAAHDRSHRASA